MDINSFDVNALLEMAHSPVHNSVIPGPSSWPIGNPSTHGTVRLFKNERNHQENIIPHSHRFNFQCVILKGEVVNRSWYKAKNGDEYHSSSLTYQDEIGTYLVNPEEIARWTYKDAPYSEGECYDMKADEVHSIYFSRGAIVLFFEGPTISDVSTILQPVANGVVVPTFEVKPWMFLKSI